VHLLVLLSQKGRQEPAPPLMQSVSVLQGLLLLVPAAQNLAPHSESIVQDGDTSIVTSTTNCWPASAVPPQVLEEERAACAAWLSDGTSAAATLATAAIAHLDGGESFFRRRFKTGIFPRRGRLFPKNEGRPLGTPVVPRSGTDRVTGDEKRRRQALR